MKKKLLVMLTACLMAHIPLVAGPTHGFYGGAFGGANWESFGDDEADIETNTGYATGLFAGYKFEQLYIYCTRMRLEGEIAYRNNSIEKVHYDSDPLSVNGHNNSLSFMANMFYEIELEGGWTPYIGVGAGLNRLSTRISSNVFESKEEKWGPAGQVIGGVSYQVACDTDLGVEYRYFRGRKHANDNAATLSLKRYF